MKKEIFRKERKGKYLFFFLLCILATAFCCKIFLGPNHCSLFRITTLLSLNKQKRKINGFLILRWKKCFLSIKAKTETKREKMTSFSEILSRNFYKLLIHIHPTHNFISLNHLQGHQREY